jgi:hypothetical protein
MIAYAGSIPRNHSFSNLESGRNYRWRYRGRFHGLVLGWYYPFRLTPTWAVGREIKTEGILDPCWLLHHDQPCHTGILGICAASLCVPNCGMDYRWHPVQSYCNQLDFGLA